MTQKIQSIPGMNDVLPDQMYLWHKIECTAREIFGHYGFREIRTPMLEETALFARGMGADTQVVQKEMYTFDDKGGDSVTMRPEGTAGVMRAYLQHSLMAQDAITKLFYLGPMFRYERPQKGRLRQFHQIGVELIGIDSPRADAEVVIMMDRLTRALGITNFRLEVNSLGTLEERRPYKTKLVEFFKSVASELCQDCQTRLETNPMRILDCKNEVCRSKAKGAPTILDALGNESRTEFDDFKRCLFNAGIAFVVNPRIVRGLDYYEKTAFEFVSDRLGSQSTFSAGGRYNRLAQELGAKTPVPAVGFSLGCERIILMLEDLLKNEKPSPQLKGIYFVAMNQSCYQECQRIMQSVRDRGYKADMDDTVKSMKSQMRRANKLNYKYAAIVGDDELVNRTVMLKNMETGEQKGVVVDEILAGIL